MLTYWCSECNQASWLRSIGLLNKIFVNDVKVLRTRIDELLRAAAVKCTPETTRRSLELFGLKIIKFPTIGLGKMWQGLEEGACCEYCVSRKEI